MSFLTAVALLGLSLFQVNTEAVASFTGTLKSADKRWIILAVENSETMKMYVTGKTRFIRNGKPSKPAEFHSGEPVTVDAERDVRLNMLATKVEFPAKLTAPEKP